MMLCKLSLSNIRKSFKDYAIYFFTLILGVCIFYVFNSIESQTAMLRVSSSTRELIKMLITILSGVSVFVSFVLGFLIMYASRFLIKKRNKEFGIYMTLGMSKKKISMLLLLETFFIGLISLGIGLVLGIFISQITSIFVANLFEADMTKFTFNFSKSATIKTIIYFGIIYLIVMIFNTIVINKCKLIDLIQSEKKNEKIKIKNPTICVILFFIAVAILGTAYYLVTAGLTKLMKYNVKILLVPITMGGVGTILFFWSISGLTLKIFMKLKKVYYKDLNIFVLKQISSKINTMVLSISMICLMIFLTLCILSSALAIKDYSNKSIQKLVPADFQLELYKTEQTAVVDVEQKFKEHGVYEEIKDLTVIEKYIDKKFTLKDSYGLYYEELKQRYPYVLYDSPVEIVKESDYNVLAQIFNFEKIELNKNEYMIVSNYEAEIYNKTMEMGSKITIFGTELSPARTSTIEGFIEMTGNPSNMGFIVVQDSIVDINDYYSKVVIGNYISNNDEKQIELNKQIYNINYQNSYMFCSKIEVKESTIGLAAITTFIGLYLGIIFLISSAAILALKELSESIDNKEKYKILRNIGADEKQINMALFKQTLIFFTIPLSLSIVHTIFGIQFCNYILSSIGINNLIKPIVLTGVFLILIYGGYFIITYKCSKNIIKNRI